MCNKKNKIYVTSIAGAFACESMYGNHIDRPFVIENTYCMGILALDAIAGQFVCENTYGNLVAGPFVCENTYGSLALESIAGPFVCENMFGAFIDGPFMCEALHWYPRAGLYRWAVCM